MQCICADAVMEVLVNHAALKGAPRGLLATSRNNEEVTKAELGERLEEPIRKRYINWALTETVRRIAVYPQRAGAAAQNGYLGK